MDKEREVTEQVKKPAGGAGLPSAEIRGDGTGAARCEGNCDYCDIIPCLVVKIDEED